MRLTRAANALLLAVLFVAASAFSFTPAGYFRPKHDSHGHLLTRDRKPLPESGSVPIADLQMERDFLGELQSEWLGYSLLGVGVFFIVRAAVIRFRSVAMPQPE